MPHTSLAFGLCHSKWMWMVCLYARCWRWEIRSWPLDNCIIIYYFHRIFHLILLTLLFSLANWAIDDAISKSVSGLCLLSVREISAPPPNTRFVHQSVPRNWYRFSLIRPKSMSISFHGIAHKPTHTRQSRWRAKFEKRIFCKQFGVPIETEGSTRTAYTRRHRFDWVSRDFVFLFFLFVLLFHLMIYTSGVVHIHMPTWVYLIKQTIHSFIYCFVFCLKRTFKGSCHRYIFSSLIFVLTNWNQMRFCQRFSLAQTVNGKRTTSPFPIALRIQSECCHHRSRQFT